MTTRLFKSIPEITVVASIGNLMYGIGFSVGNYYIFFKKPGKQWVSRHGPYKSRTQAESQIITIKDEYNAVRAAQNKR